MPPEINSSFHRAHARTVYAKWARLTPADFRFAVKLARTITHAHGFAASKRRSADNAATGAAAENALELITLTRRRRLTP